MRDNPRNMRSIVQKKQKKKATTLDTPFLSLELKFDTKVVVREGGGRAETIIIAVKGQNVGTNIFFEFLKNIQN